MAEYLLSQHDDRGERVESVGRARRRHAYDSARGFPVSSAFEHEDEPALSWQLKSLHLQEKLRLNLRALKRRGKWNFVNDLPPLEPRRLASMIRSGDVAGIIDYFMPLPGGTAGPDVSRSLDDYRSLFALTELPPAVGAFESDTYFAEKMVAGPDPTRLTRLVEIPRKFPIDSSHLASVPDFAGEDLSTVMAAGRAYWVDHEAMAELRDGAHPQGPKYMYAPMVAFAVPRGGGPLKPFAIQCGQAPEGRAIYTPRDGSSWELAKNCVSAAHNTYHEVLTHLGYTHLMSEAILVSTLRNLAANHPIAVLLRRHFEGTMSINKLAVQILIQPGKAVEYLIGSNLESTYPWLAKHRSQRSFRDHYLPTHFANTQTDRATALPHHPYRDDGLLVWNAVRNWAAEFVAAFYPEECDVRADHELQEWAREISSPNGGRVSDFGRAPGSIADRDDLIEILTMVIWTAGPQHAAVNFPQRDHMSFVPANPLAGYTPEPMGKAHTKADWLANLPPLDVAVHQLCVMTFLGSVRHTVLGDYGDDFEHTPVAPAHRRFLVELDAVEDEIAARNRRRPHPYEYLRPSLIPNSTNI